jgi:hypothetical protein
MKYNHCDFPIASANSGLAQLNNHWLLIYEYEVQSFQIL